MKTHTFPLFYLEEECPLAQYFGEGGAPPTSPSMKLMIFN